MMFDKSYLFYFFLGLGALPEPEFICDKVKEEANDN